MYEKLKSARYITIKPLKITKSENLYFPRKKFAERPDMISAMVRILISINGYAKSKNILRGVFVVNVRFTTNNKK